MTAASRPRVAFVVNGGPESAMGERATAFQSRLTRAFDIQLIFREGGKFYATRRMLRQLFAFRPALCYVFDMAAAGIAAAGAYCKLARRPLVVDTGDSIVDLGRVLGRGRLGLLATRALEAFALRASALIVVRGSWHRDLLVKRGLRTAFLPDGVTVNQFALPEGEKREAGRPLVVGLVGSAVWIPTRRTCYGYELVELVRLLKERLPNQPVRGMLIGDGSGIVELRRRCESYGIADRMEFVGRIPYADLPAWLQRFDVCLSTQTDDAIGWARTTGKLPLYLAAGRFILASRVGEAARVLPEEMLVDFHGSIDPEYPNRLATRVVELLAKGMDFSHRSDCVALARRYFDYDLLAIRLAALLGSVLEKRPVFGPSRIDCGAIDGGLGNRQ